MCGIIALILLILFMAKYEGVNVPVEMWLLIAVLAIIDFVFIYLRGKK